MIVAVTINKPPEETWGLNRSSFGKTVHEQPSETIPLYSHTKGWRDIDNEGLNLESRLSYRAERRNEAVKIALGKWPDATDVMMIDSWYLSQTQAAIRLAQRYQSLEKPAIIGPAIWGRMRTNLSQFFHSPVRFYDAWATPDLRWCPNGWRPETDILTSQEKVPLRGLYRVTSIGGLYIFPRSIWENGVRYGVPADLHGCEHNFFHSSTILPKYIDFTTELWRIKKYSLGKCVRCSVGNWLRTRN